MQKNFVTIINVALLLCLSGPFAGELAAAEKVSRPNILFCISDDASFPHCGAYGCKWVKTPAFDRIAKEGLLFTNAYTPNAKCSPSRACILTGRNSWQLEAACNHWCYYPEKFVTYPETLAKNGYFVGYTGKGWAPGRVSGGRMLTGKSFSSKRAKPPTGAISANDYAANFADFLEAAPEEQPWCFWYGCTEPHRSYAFQSGAKIGGKKIDSIDKVPGFWPDTETVRHDMLDYAFEIEHFDNHLEKMLAQLEKTGQLENTLVVVTSDNGMPFPRIKGQEYEYSNHLPLAVMWKKGIVKPGRTIDDYVSFIDFAPTFLQVADVSQKTSGMQPITGKSLVPYFTTDKEGKVDPSRNFVVIGKERHDIGRPNDWGYPIRGIVTEGVLYLQNFEPKRWPSGNPESGYLNCDGSPTKTQILDLNREKKETQYWKQAFGKRSPIELYNIAEDPCCLKNLADNPEWKAKREKLAARLLKVLKEQKDQRVLGKPSYYEEMPYAQTSQQGYYENFTLKGKWGAGWTKRSDVDPEANPDFKSSPKK